MPDGSSSAAPVMMPGPRMRRNCFRALNIGTLPSPLTACEATAATGSFRVVYRPGPRSPERTVRCQVLEHGELRNEHLVDDVQDTVVRDHVGLDDMPAVDLDAFPHSGGHGISGDITQRVSIGIEFFLPQGNLRDVRPYAQPLPLERFE